MKYFVLILLFACSWNHKDFEKTLSKDVSAADPQVEVDESLRDKFEVQEKKEETKVEEKKELAQPNKKEIKIKTDNKKVPLPTVAKKTKSPAPIIVKPAPKKLPEDYPAELIEVEKKASAVWKQYKPNHNLEDKIFLNINYMGMTVGKIMFTNNGKKVINDKEVWHFHARFKSAPFYSRIYELDDTVDTYVTTDEFLSTRYSLVQRESKQDVDDLQLHDREQLKTFWFYKRVTKDKEKEKKESKYIPYHSLDPFSVVFFYQGLPLKNGDVYEIPLINKTKILIFKTTVIGRETIETTRGEKKAIKVHAVTQYTGDHLKSGELTFWFSDDDKRTLLKGQAKIKIGSVTAEIVNK